MVYEARSESYLQQHEELLEDTQCEEPPCYLEHPMTALLFELLYHSTDTIQDCNKKNEIIVHIYHHFKCKSVGARVHIGCSLCMQLTQI